MKSESSEDFSLKVRIHLINEGKVTINRNTITVESTTYIGSKKTKFIRIFNKEELDSIELATNLTSTEDTFRNCYKAAKDLFNCLKLLYFYGNPYQTICFEKFSDLLNNNRYLGNYECFFDLIRKIPSQIMSESQFEIKGSLYSIPKLPKSLTVENILFLSMNKNPNEYLSKLRYPEMTQLNEQFKNFPYLSMIEFLNMNEPSSKGNRQSSINFEGEFGSRVEKKFYSILDFFELNNIHFIKVDKPANCYHILYLASQLFIGLEFVFGQILYCHKNTDIRHFLKEFTSMQTIFEKCIIFHPEFLDESNYNILLEETKVRISAVSTNDNLKILVISSHDFTKEKGFYTNFNEDDITCCRLTSIRSLVEPSIGNVCLESSSYQNNDNEDTQFIDREKNHARFSKKNIRFKFAPELFDDAIDFWDELFSTVFYGYYVTNNEIISFSAKDFEAVFEEPHIGLINNLNDFPFPIKNDKRRCESVFFPTHPPQQPNGEKDDKVETFLKSIFKKEDFKLNENDPLIEIIKKIYKPLFNVDNFTQNVSNTVLRYISDYILQFSSEYIDCLWSKVEEVRIARLLLLIKSALNVYNLAPKNDLSIMCFSGMLDSQSSPTKSIDFYTTSPELNQLLFYNFRNVRIGNKEINFNIHLKKELTKNPDYPIFIKCLTTSKIDFDDIYYSLSWPKFFKAVGIVSRLSLSHPTILSGDTGCGKTSFINMFQQLVKKIANCKIKFFQNLNIHGDVNRKDIENHIKSCSSKNPDYNTFFFDEFNTSDALPYVEYIFINGYKENGIKQPFKFLGAINPLVKANSTSKILSKIGMEQNIYTESSRVNLLNLKKSKENLNDYKYFVHKLNESECLIIDFNPAMIEPEKESEFLPAEEKMLIKKVIDANINKKFKDSYVDTLFNSIKWIRTFMKENAVVSIRDVKNFIDFYKQYNIEIKNTKDDEKLNDQMFNLAIISVFALRLPLKLEILQQNRDILQHAKDLNMEISEDETTIFVRKSFLKIIGNPDELIKLFDKFTYWYLRDKIMRDDKIWKFKSFLYHVVIMMLTIKMKKACFVIGPPGTSKSFALEQIAKYDSTFITTYMCSRGSSSEGLKAQFFDAIYIGKIDLRNCEIEGRPNVINSSVISFEEMGLANINKRRPLKYIHFALDLGIEINELPQYEKVASIGVSNYAMDLANMNRGILVYTDIPDIIDLKVNFLEKITFANDYKKIGFTEFDLIYETFLSKLNEMKENAQENWIENFFNALWPNNSKPKNLALRSIYSLYQIVSYIKNENGQNISPSLFCRIAREVVNARRLIKINEQNEINEDFKDLAIHAFDFILRMFPKSIYNIPDVLLEKPINVNHSNKDYKFEINSETREIKCTFNNNEIKYFRIKVDNLYIMIDRIISNDSSKSLCLLTQDYSALDNIQSILLDNLPSTTDDLQFILDSNDSNEVIQKIKNMPESKYSDISFYFEENFKETDSSSKSQKSVNNFIHHLIHEKSKEIPIIVGNNPMLDSLLDILNANKIDPSDKDKKTFNALISSDGFSWSYDIPTDFYLVLILELNELVSKIGAIPLPLLDRLEIVYIDWNKLKYLAYFKLIRNSERFVENFVNSNLSYREFVDQIDINVCQYLNTQILPDNRCQNRFNHDNNDQYLHSSLATLFAQYYKFIEQNNNNENSNKNNRKSKKLNRSTSKKNVKKSNNNNNNDDDDDDNDDNENSNKKNRRNKRLNKSIIKKANNNNDDNDDVDDEKFQLIENKDLSEYLLSTKWNKSIKCVIYTKSMLGDNIYFSDFRKNSGEQGIREIIIDDETIADEEDFNKQLINKDERPLIIKCSKYSNMHDQHLKKLIENSNYEGCVFIIYYYTGKETIKSTMNWPVFWIEDISNNYLVLNSNNSEDLKNICNNLNNPEFRIKSKPIMEYLVIKRLLELLQIQNNFTKIKNHFVDFIKNYYQDNCCSLIDHYDEFHENLDSIYSIQTQIFNHLMNQVKEKLFRFVKVIVSHFLTKDNMEKFMPKKVYEFLRVNYKELPNEIEFEANSDFKCIFKNDVKSFLCNSPLLYFQNTFGYRFLTVIKESSPFEQFIEFFKDQRYRNHYFSTLKFDNEEKLINHLNRKNFRINKKFSRKIFELMSNDRKFNECSKQLLLSKGINIDDILDPKDPVINTYYNYSDETNFDGNIDPLLNLLNSNDQYDYITNSFEGIFIYFDYILNINIFELMTKEAYDDFDEFYTFPNKNDFWNRYILSYIVSKKMKNRDILLNYKNIYDEYRYKFFFTKEQLNNPDLLTTFANLYSQFFFTAPQVANSNLKIKIEFINLLTVFYNQMNSIARTEDKKIDSIIIENLIRSSCILNNLPSSTPIDKSIFNLFTADITDLNYCNEILNRFQRFVDNFNKQKNKTEIVQYKWDSIRNNILTGNNISNLLKNPNSNNWIDAPDFNNHSLLEILHLYMTDFASFEEIMGDKSDQFCKWLFQDTEESPLFLQQIYILFRAVHSKNDELINNQLIALLSISAPWKVFTHEDLNSSRDSNYNFFTFDIINEIIKLPVNFCTKEAIIESASLKNLDSLNLWKTIMLSNSYVFIDNALYTLDINIPTISTTVYDYLIFEKKSEFPVLKSFIQLQKYRNFLTFASKIMKISFKLRKLFAKNSRALFVILNCFSFVKDDNYELIQDLPFLSAKFDKLFNLKNNESRNIFKKDDFNGCSNAYLQIEFISKKYFNIHNDFVSIQDEKIVLPAYDFIPKMAITQFDFNKFVAENILKGFCLLYLNSFRNPVPPQKMNEMLIKTLQNNYFPLVTFDLNKRFKFDKQPELEAPQVDFLGMCKEDWEIVLSTLVNVPDSTFVRNMRKDPDQTKGFNMTKIASFLLQIYYRDQSEEYLDQICPPLDFGDQITINMGFEIPDIILNVPVFEYLPNDIKTIIRNIFN